MRLNDNDKKKYMIKPKHNDTISKEVYRIKSMIGKIINENEEFHETLNANPSDGMETNPIMDITQALITMKFKIPPKINKQGDFTSLTWIDEIETSNIVIAISYKKNEPVYYITIEDPTNNQDNCYKIDDITQAYKERGIRGSYKQDGETCGSMMVFGVEKINTLQSIVGYLLSKFRALEF